MLLGEVPFEIVHDGVRAHTFLFFDSQNQKHSLTRPSLHAHALPPLPSGRRVPSAVCATKDAFAAAQDNIPPRLQDRCLVAGRLWPTVTQTIWSRLTSGHPLPLRAPPCAGTWADQFGVCAFFASPRRLQHHPVKRGSCPQPTPKQWKAVNDDLRSTAVRQVRRSQVHVPNEHICCHTSTSFAAHACCRTLQRISPPSQNPRPTSRLDGHTGTCAR